MRAHRHTDTHTDTHVCSRIPCIQGNLWVYTSSLAALSIIKACPTQQANTHTQTHKYRHTHRRSRSAVKTSSFFKDFSVPHLSLSLTLNFIFKLSRIFLLPTHPSPSFLSIYTLTSAKQHSSGEILYEQSSFTCLKETSSERGHK